jgi:hypothetical protein
MEIVEKPQAEFTECDICAAKPGSPTLCSGCLKNRQVIGAVNSLLKAKL